MQVGDRVLFNRFSGKQIECGVEDATCGSCSDTLLIMREIEIMGVVTGDEKVLPGYEAPKWNKPTAGLTI